MSLLSILGELGSVLGELPPWWKHRAAIINPPAWRSDPAEELLSFFPLCSQGTRGWCLGQGRAVHRDLRLDSNTSSSHPGSFPRAIPSSSFLLEISDPIQPFRAEKAHPHTMNSLPAQEQSTGSRKPPPHPPSPWCFLTPDGSSPFARSCFYKKKKKKKIYFQLSAASVARQPSRLHIIAPGSGSSGEAV